MTKIHLRSVKLKGGVMRSLYFDFYPALVRPDTLKFTRREFLKMHIYANPSTFEERQHNSETIALANAIKAQRQIDIQNEYYGFISSKGKAITVIDYFTEQVKKRKDNDTNWLSAANYVKKFFGTRNVRISELSLGHCNQYREFLLTCNSIRRFNSKLHQNSAVSYFNKYKAMLKAAYRSGLIKTDLNSRVDCIKSADTVKEYLSLEELKLLSITECKSPLLKKAALFSALTGLRHCDIAALEWQNIRFSEHTQYAIHFRQSKTKGVEVLPISSEAVALLGERKNNEDKIFPGLKYSFQTNMYLRDWLRKAKIEKNRFGFHAFRHSHATLLLTLGVDLYTVSKMLGHKNIKTTQVYARVIDKSKIEAANKISLL